MTAPTPPASPAVEVLRTAQQLCETIRTESRHFDTPDYARGFNSGAMGCVIAIREQINSLASIAAPPTPRVEEELSDATKRMETTLGAPFVSREAAIRSRDKINDWVRRAMDATPRAEIGDEARAREVLENEISCALSDDTPISPSHAIAAMLAFAAATPAPVVGDGLGLTPEYLAMTPLQKWGALTVHGLLGTNEPWIEDMRQTLDALAATPASVTPDAGGLRHRLCLLLEVSDLPKDDHTGLAIGSSVEELADQILALTRPAEGEDRGDS